MRDVDLTVSNYELKGKIIRPVQGQKIPRPDAPSSQSKSLEPKDTEKKRESFKIQKTVEAQSSSIPEEHRKILQPQIQLLKRSAKLEAERRKERQKLIAQGIISEDEKSKQNAVDKIEDDGVRVDQSGKARDKSDNLVIVKNQSATALTNKTKEKEEKAKEMQKRVTRKTLDRATRGLRDSNLIMRSSKKRTIRASSGLHFSDIDKAKDLYHQNQNTSIDDLLKQPNKSTTGIQNLEYTRRKNKVRLQFNQAIPDKQWWDDPLLVSETYQPLLSITKASDIPDDMIKLDQITASIQKGALFKEQEEQQIVMPVYLTKDERKKLRRRRKQERLKEKNNQIKLGMIEPDKPKIKLSNMAIVKKEEFILDPSRVQAEVKKQIQERLDKHIETNTSRKLTKEKKAEKALRKLKRDSAKETRVAIFRIESVKDRTARFKIQMNVKQLALNGYFLVPTEGYRGPAAVIIEGGRRAIRFFKNLMLNRINWTETYRSNLLTKEEAEEAGATILQDKVAIEGNKCRLVWQAVVAEPTFNRWRTEGITSDNDAVRVLSERRVQHYWDSVVNYRDQL